MPSHLLLRELSRIPLCFGRAQFGVRPFRWLAPAAMLLVMLGIATRAQAATIFVTSTVQKVDGTGGCSLQEAIYASNWHVNKAISTVDGTIINTECVPGDGNDTMVLPIRGTFSMSFPLADQFNYLGFTATPLIFSNITIEANGSTLQWVGPLHVRAFAVGTQSVNNPEIGPPVSGTGSLTIRNAYIKGFSAKGGDAGLGGGGGGLGAGGAIYVNGGALTVENSTLDSNRATGGNGAAAGGSAGGGGGGLAGNGGSGQVFGSGAGGGGSFGNGGAGGGGLFDPALGEVFGGGGGGGGGTDSSGQPGSNAGGGTAGFCGGAGGNSGLTNVGGSGGSDAACPGGGGGGGGVPGNCAPLNCAGGHGGNGNYGGGGGGGGWPHSNGGNGGFGGGGGGPATCPLCGPLDLNSHAGNGGFGGGGGPGGAANTFTNAGVGGRFGGDGTSGGGGGGAALGGAIFSDTGTVVIRNSTLFGNFVDRGTGGNGADNGADGGGAIFSRNGSLTVNDSTISGNQSTGSGGGIVVVNDGSATSFVLDNTIIAGNGANECFFLGSVTTAGTGNLIVNNGSGTAISPCPGVVTSADPLLGPLQNNQGFTPTMAIPKTSPAFNGADPTTSLSTDQRGQVRPAPNMGGVPDIGAFELCLTGFGFVQVPCIISAGIEQTETLTVKVSPAAGGSTTPAPGSYNEPLDSVIVLRATPNPGFGFVDWTGAVADPTSRSTAVVMTNPQTVTANFVRLPATATSLVASLNPSVFGQTVTFTATVTSATPGTITGTVTFMAGATVLGSGVISSGKATLLTSGLAVGVHSLTAVYSGSTTYAPSTSPVLSHTVNKAASSTSVSSSHNPSVFGQSVTFTATVAAVSPGSGTPTGSVTLKGGATVLQTIALSSGKATFTTSALTVGAHSITAVYNGNVDFSTSASAALAQTVDKAATSTTLTSSLNPLKLGQTLTFTTTVAAVSPGSGIPAGSVTLKDGATVLQTIALSSGKATFTTSALTVGAHSITSSYSGSVEFTTSTSPALTQTVNKAATSTALAASLNPTVFGQAVTFTATVTSTTPGTISGTVTFKDGTIVLGSGIISSGKATFVTSALAAGSHSITAVYSGNATFGTSTSSALSHTVNKAATSTSSVSSSHNPSVFGQSLTFTVTVAPVSPATATPTGTVTFKNGLTVLSSVTLVSGKASFSTSTLAVGAHSITATYNGNVDYNTSTSVALTQTVNKAATATMLTALPNPSPVGMPIVFSVTVATLAPGSATPTGSVTLKDGATVLQTIALSSGKATFGISSLAHGSHSMTAVYAGSTNNLGSTSAVLTEMVD